MRTRLSANPAIRRAILDRLNAALSRLTSTGSAWRARAVDSVTSGTMTTKARLTSRGSRTARTPPLTLAAATRPPTVEAAALSGCPSIWAATASGSLAPAAAAAATARAADEPSPRAMGICDRTVMARRSVPATSMATRAARWEGSSDSPAPSPSDRTISLVAGSTSTSTYRSNAMASVSKPGPRLADDAGTRARTPTRYSPTVRAGRTISAWPGLEFHRISADRRRPSWTGRWNDGVRRPATEGGGLSRGAGATTNPARARSSPASTGPSPAGRRGRTGPSPPGSPGYHRPGPASGW